MPDPSHPTESPDPDALCFAFRAGELLVVAGSDGMRVPRVGEARVGHVLAGPMDVGEMGGVRCLALALPADYVAGERLELRRLRWLHSRIPDAEYAMAGRASEILEWDAAHRFCGRCGGRTEPSGEALARRCAECGALHYPRLSPAVLISVVRDGRILLARSPHFQPGMYSTLAGFVDPGESLEETCVREVREEVGIEVTNVRYFGSQPWPYPSSLMVAFTADYTDGELAPDPVEIEDAGWYAPGELPTVPPPLSLARRMIDHFVREHGGDPSALRTVE